MVKMTSFESSFVCQRQLWCHILATLHPMCLNRAPYRHIERAGERAARVLPAVFTAAEMCIEALAIDTARAEAVEDEDADDRSADTMPVLSDRQATHWQI